MTSRFFAGIVLILTAGNLFAQEGGKIKESNAHIGLVYPISTNGVDAINYKNRFSLHAIAGVSASEEAFCASGVANIIRFNGNGCVLGGSCNIIIENAEGLQAAGFINYIGKSAKGVQAAGFANITGRSKGLQAAGFANINISSVRGAQLGGFINLAKKVNGFQGAGFINLSEKTTGAQVAGFANISGNVKGTQIAGYINKADKVHSQVAGFLNIAGEVKGVQVSGFMNIADSCDFPIGFVNISKKGEKFIGMTIDNNLNTLVTFRSGGRYLYGIVGAGANLSYTEPLYALEAGMGVHIPLVHGFRINTEISNYVLSDFWTTAQFTATLRVMPAIKLTDRMELFGGPTLNYESSDTYAFPDGRTNNLWKRNQWGYYQSIYVGVLGGLHFDI